MSDEIQRKSGGSTTAFLVAGMAGALPPALWVVGNATRPDVFDRVSVLGAPLTYLACVILVTATAGIASALFVAVQRSTLTSLLGASSLGALTTAVIAVGSTAMPEAEFANGEPETVTNVVRFAATHQHFFKDHIVPARPVRSRSFVRDQYAASPADGMTLAGLGWEEHGLPLRCAQTPRLFSMQRETGIHMIDTLPNLLALIRLRPIAFFINTALFAAVLWVGWRLMAPALSWMRRVLPARLRSVENRSG